MSLVRQHPLEAGFGAYAGSLYNLNTEPVPTPSGPTPTCPTTPPLGYSNWVKTFDADGDGVLDQACELRYATTDSTDDAIGFARTLASPWFLYVAYNAPHIPVHAPPPALCPPSGTCAAPYCPWTSADEADGVNAMIESVDTELGRLLAAVRSVDPDVYVLLLGDNGTGKPGAQGPLGSCFGPDRVKGSFYEGGLNVPLLVAGPDVVPGECAALVSSTDVFATVMELAGFEQAPPEDSVSLVPYLRGDPTPRRATVYAERFSPNARTPDSPLTPAFAPQRHVRAIRDERYKLIRATSAKAKEIDFFFDLLLDPCEAVNLCKGPKPFDPATLTEEQLDHYAALCATLAAMGVD